MSCDVLSLELLLVLVLQPYGELGQCFEVIGFSAKV
jgi:hypothetical protein